MARVNSLIAINLWERVPTHLSQKSWIRHWLSQYYNEIFSRMFYWFMMLDSITLRNWYKKHFSVIILFITSREEGLVLSLNFARRPQLLLSLLLICSVWNFHVRPSSKSMPRYFISLIVSIFCPLILKLRFLVILLFFVRNKIISVL